MQVQVVSFIPYSKLTESFWIVFGLNSKGSRYCNRLLLVLKTFKPVLRPSYKLHSKGRYLKK